MNKRELRKIIREELLKEANKPNLNEGILEKLLMAFLSPMIKREVNKIKNDPDIKAAEESVSYAIDQYIATSKRALENMKSAEKRRQEEFEERRKSWASLRQKK